MEILGILLCIVFAAILVVAAVFSFAGFIILFAVILLLTLPVIKFMIVPYFENRQHKRLDDNHILLLAQRQAVRIDVNQRINGYNPYVIDCYYTDENTGRQFVFTSPPFMTDPSPYLGGVTLGIFVNPEDYSNYYVDVSKIPRQGENI